MIKKLLQTVLFLVAFFSLIQAQSVLHKEHGEHHRIGKKGKKIETPAFNKQAMLQEDSINERNKVGGMRFAKQFTVDLTPQNSGELITYPDSSKLWLLDITSEGAYSINLIFSNYHLLKGDTVYVYNELGNKIVGPLTEKNNLKSGVLPLAPIDGSNLKVEFRQSALISPLRKLEIGSINHDYRNFRGLPNHNDFWWTDNSGDSCSLPVSCVPEITQVKQSVCLLIINGIELCSGTMVNNTAQDGKPYLLSAAHCFDVGTEGVDYAEAETVAPTIVAFFNYEMPKCEPTIRGSQEFTIGGSTLKAFASDIDFALVELSSMPPVDFRPYYAGWNISASPSAPFRGIHHPFGKVKVMARENNAITNTTYSGLLSNSHWLVSRWDTGTTQGGSSGSGLFDANLRLVGSLTGGFSECLDPINDYYFRLNKAWSYYPSATAQLKAWLDPTNSGVTAIDGLNPYGNDSALRYSNLSLSDTAEIARLSSPNSGYVAGHNSFYMYKYAERYSLPENAFLYGVYFVTAKANATQSTTDTIEVKVYAGDSIPNSAYFLDEKSLILNTLQWESSKGFYYSNKAVLSKNENYVRFDTPVAVGKSFFIVYELPYTNLPADSFAVYTAKPRNASGIQTALAYYGAQWTKITDIVGIRTSLWIDPVISYDSTAIAVDSSLIDRSAKTVIYPNPAKDIVYVMTRTDKEGDCTITLYSTYGQKYSTTSGKVRYKSIPVDVSSLPQGLYLLRVAYSDKVETHKLIVE